MTAIYATFKFLKILFIKEARKGNEVRQAELREKPLELKRRLTLTISNERHGYNMLYSFVANMLFGLTYLHDLLSPTHFNFFLSILGDERNVQSNIIVCLKAKYNLYQLKYFNTSSRRFIWNI